MRVSCHILLPLWLATLGTQVRGARILAVLAVTSGSHHGFMVSVLRALASAGHEVVLYSTFKLKTPYANLTEILVEGLVPTEEDVIKMFTTMTSEKNTKDTCWDTYDGLEWFQKLISNDIIKGLISSNEKFDLIVTEAFTMQEFNLIFGLIFKAPTISISALPTWSLLNNNIGNSLSITSLPNLCTLRPNNMSFSDRFLNAYYILRRNYIYYNHQLPSLEHEMRRHFNDMPPLMDMIQNVSLAFVNDHLTTSYAQPRTPNLIPVGGIHLRPPKSLPQDLQKFMDEAQDGVILFSLGTFVPEQVKSKEYFEIFKGAFRPLKQRVLWKTTQVMKDLPPNVLITDWLPQPDILAHKNCILFITHGGINSQIETIHFGVPVIVIPYFADQPNNAMLYVAKGVGILLEPNELTREALSTAISTVLRNPSYARRMKALSAVFRDRPMSPEQTVVYWTEYVLRHGGAPHLRPAPQPLYQRALLDVVAALLAAISVIVIVACVTLNKLKGCILNYGHTKVTKVD